MGPAALGSIAWALRWLVLIVVLSILLEMLASALLERLQVITPAAERRTACVDCVNYFGRADSELVAAVHEEARNIVSETAPGQLPRFDDTKRRAVGKRVLNSICRGQSKGCVTTIAKFKAQALRYIIGADELFAFAMHKAQVDRLSDRLPAGRPRLGYDPALETAAHKRTLGSLCAPLCQPATLLDTLIPATFFSDPRVVPVLAVLAELWGTILMVGIVGALLLLTLHVRSSAARRQHVLYQRLVAQFKHRVTPAGTAPGAPASAASAAAVGSTVSKSRAPGHAGASTGSKSNGRVT
jgi:hypothetical protein